MNELEMFSKTISKYFIKHIFKYYTPKNIEFIYFKNYFLILYSKGTLGITMLHLLILK